MDDSRFDELVKGLGGASRRSLVGAAGAAALAALFGRDGADEALARKKRKKRKKKPQKPPEPCGGDMVCTAGRFCCDDEREICCNPGDGCCNIGPGTGSCCPSPNRCARPVGNDDAPFECCPPERQSFAFGVVRCCPVGERSLGTEISSDDGPCCPEEKYCSQDLTGGKCCPDIAPVCLDRDTGACCTEEKACGDSCCQEPFGECCNGECWYSENGPYTPCGEDLCCWAGTTCCGEGEYRVCCEEDLVCRTPCGDLGAACCHPEAVNCCNTECDPVTGCGG